MKRFIFTIMFALILGVGQSFAFDDVGEQQTVLAEQSAQIEYEFTAVTIEVLPDVGKVATVELSTHAVFEFKPTPNVEQMRQTPAVIIENKQEVVLAENLPPNQKAFRYS
jgi:hypothetical protein